MLCEELDVSRREQEEKLKSEGYSYDAQRNQFV